MQRTEYLDVEVEEDEDVCVRQIKQEGSVGEVKRFFGELLDKQWGYDQRYLSTKKYYTDPESHVCSIMAMMDEQMADIERYAIAFLNNELCKHIELLFSPLQGFVSDVTNDLKNGLKDRSATDWKMSII